MAVRIAFFIWALERGGAERQLVTLLRGLDRRRFEPHLLVAFARDDFGITREVPTTVLAEGDTFDLRAYGSLVRTLRVLKPAIVHSWMGAYNIYARLAAPLAGSPRVIGSVRAMNMPYVDVITESLTRPLVDYVIVNSIGTRDELIRRVRLSSNKIEVIENGVDTAVFSPLRLPERTAARVSLGFDGHVALVTPARICAQKNQIALVDALAMMRARGLLDPATKLFVYGRESEPIYAASLRAAIKRARLCEHIELRPPALAIERVLAAADVVVLPSVFEGLPNAVIEALACGTPAVVSPAANVDRIVTDGYDGFTARGATPADLAEALAQCLALSPDGRKRMGHDARDSAVARFSIERMVSATEKVYDRVLAVSL